ncbi:predicted protein [Naegleria gruberi]|uniref:Predicted protein n=1 Tax=Naegleria gruberi TaxID=5762 RepID=D2VWN7_NAEGR|nr:uncharacterized protein NAEGRDRAFT_59423 [Naegleria gruberi]EFC38654.1 predicted protein [Naegleria gruberi]|eukprot:XP_002671398.1 predicted protein [Naegleria gruberi strain NEG-M]
MESPLKKKKLDHNTIIPREEENITSNENVKIIFSNELSESLMLKKKLGGNKVRTFHIMMSSSSVSIDGLYDIDSKQVRACPQRKWLILGTGKEILIYDSESGKLLRTIKLRHYLFDLDSSGECLYIYSDRRMRKTKLDLSSEWKSCKFSVDRFTVCESKNEIYTIHKLDITVLDSNNGSVKRSIDIGEDFSKKWRCTKISYDEKEGKIYLSGRAALESDDSSTSSNDSSDEEPGGCGVIIVEERTEERNYVKCEDGVDFTMPFGKYFACFTFSDMAYIYDSKTKDLLSTFYSTDICEEDERITYFDSVTNTLFCQKKERIYCGKLNIMESLIETPINKETCFALEKLGAIHNKSKLHSDPLKDDFKERLRMEEELAKKKEQEKKKEELERLRLQIEEDKSKRKEIDWVGNALRKDKPTTATKSSPTLPPSNDDN